MALGCVPDVVAERDCLHEVLVQSQAPSDRPADLGYELRVERPVCYLVVFHHIE